MLLPDSAVGDLRAGCRGTGGSICCEARSSFYEDALRLNSVVHHGGISIRDIDGVPYFVMIDTYPRATVSGEDIRRSVIELGYRADAVEQLLTGKDVN